MKKKNLKLILLLLGILFTVSTISIYNSNNYEEYRDEKVDIRDKIDLKNPKKSAIYPESFIHIDGSISNNWSLTESTYDWCSGDGSWDNPYIIENVSINAGGSGNGIFIENSKNDYFIIRNCNVTNAGSGPSEAGIKLVNTNNGTLSNNNCSNNGYYGINLSTNCYNNTISENIVNGNNECGISLSGFSNDNNISGNLINDDNLYGIYLLACHYNNISKNIVNNHTSYGIYLDTCNENTISGNFVSNSSNHGLYLIECSDNKILGNTLTENVNYGIWIENWPSDGNILSENLVYNNGYGIMLLTCQNSLIFYNCFFSSYQGSNAVDTGGSSNNWNNSVVGNYNNHYLGTDIDADGIGDQPYNIPGTTGSIDYKPLMDYDPFFFKPPNDLTYENGTEGHKIRWIVIHNLPPPLTFNISREGSIIKTGYLDPYVTYIEINVDGLNVGSYNYTIVVEDGLGGTRSDIVWITVKSPPKPPSGFLIGDDDDDDDDDDVTIVFGHYHLLFAILTIAILVIIYKRKTFLNKR